MNQFANQIGYTDVHPFEVVRQVSGKCLEIRAMSAERDPTWKPVFHQGGFVANCSNQQDQRWIIQPDPSAPAVRIRLHKDGRWKDANGNRYALDTKPYRFYDYNF